MTPESNINSADHEQLSSHQLVSRYMRGEIPLDKYSKLFMQNHKTIDFLQILSDENSRRSFLELILSSLKDKKSNK